MPDPLDVAVVGAGVSGIAAAWELERAGHRVTLYESEAQLGGHTRTEVVPGASTGGGDLPVDVGFIVHNGVTYPEFTRFLRELGVATRDTEMSFAVDCAGCGLEYAGRGLDAQLPQLLRPRMLRLILEILRFQRLGRRLVADGRPVPGTLDDFVRRHRFSHHFTAHYLVPMTAAIWSTAPRGVLDFPIEHALHFFHNHGLLRLRGLQWRTIPGGSQRYVDAFVARFRGEVRVGSPVARVDRSPGGPLVHVTAIDAAPTRHDAVVLAVHADDALRLLHAPGPEERRVLAGVEFTSSEVLLHHDERLLPARPELRASWCYHLPSCDLGSEGRPTMSYCMNLLQGLDAPRTWSVTLNRGAEIDPDAVVARHRFSHPRYTAETLAAQRDLPGIQGVGGVWFAGAWTRSGFHEDGFASGAAAARAIDQSHAAAHAHHDFPRPRGAAPGLAR